jgi:hypothetical protein
MSTTPPMSESLGLPAPGQLSANDLMRALTLGQQQQQQAPPGTTTAQPNFQSMQQPQAAPRQPAQPVQSAQAYGPGQGGAARKNDMQNLVRSAQGLANQVGQQVQQRKIRQYQQVTGNFMTATKGVNDAQAQVQQGQQLLQQAAQRLQQNPNDPQARQMIQQGQQLTQQGKQALQINKAKLDDIAADPKQHKIISKAFGVDDKNANSPERQALVQQLQKSMGVGAGAAGLISGIPQTAQLSPQAQQQAMAVQAGALGKPATGGQQLQAATQLTKTAETEAGKMARATMGDTVRAATQGMKYDDSGKLVPMTPEEIQKNPVLSSSVAVKQARTEMQQAQAELAAAKTAAVPEQIKIAEAKVNLAQANLGMRQKEFNVKLSEEERKQYETRAKFGEPDTSGAPPESSKPLESWAQKSIATANPVLDQVNGLLKDLEPLKDNNQAGYLAADRLGYAMGFGSKNGQLAADVSNIELQRVIGASRVLAGSSRAFAALQAAMVHTPNAWKDSPQLMYQKLQTIKSNIEGTIRDAELYGQKNQHATEMPKVSGSPTAPPATPPPSSSKVLTYDPATGTVK